MSAKRVPLTDEVLSAMEVAKTTVEAAEYLHDQFVKVLTDAKMADESQGIIAKVQEFVQYVRYSLLSNSNYWLGELNEPSDFKNMQHNIAENLSTEIESNIVEQAIKLPISLDIAISDISQLLRGYSSESKPLDPEMVEMLDKLFNAWLAENNIVSKDGVLYQVDDKGNIKMDAKNRPMIVNPEQLRSLLTDNNHGLAKFFQDRGIDISIIKHPYPSAVDAAPDAAPEAAPATVPAAPPPPAAETTPPAPPPPEFEATKASEVSIENQEAGTTPAAEEPQTSVKSRGA